MTQQLCLHVLADLESAHLGFHGPANVTQPVRSSADRVRYTRCRFRPYRAAPIGGENTGGIGIQGQQFLHPLPGLGGQW